MLHISQRLLAFAEAPGRPVALVTISETERTRDERLDAEETADRRLAVDVELALGVTRGASAGVSFSDSALLGLASSCSDDMSTSGSIDVGAAVGKEALGGLLSD